MSKWDKEYIKLCKKILKEGKRVENRTGMDIFLNLIYLKNFQRLQLNNCFLDKPFLKCYGFIKFNQMM